PRYTQSVSLKKASAAYFFSKNVSPYHISTLLLTSTTSVMLVVPLSLIPAGFLKAVAQTIVVCHPVPTHPKRHQGIVWIARIAVLMIGKFTVEHIKNEAIASLVGVDGFEQFFTMTHLHFTVGRQIAFADDVASAINSTHLVRIRRFQPQLFHRLFELFVSKGKYH